MSLLLLHRQVATAAQVTETFDSPGSAAANGWAVRYRETAVIGFSNTAEAGGAPGEARAVVSGFDSGAAYFDTTVGGTLTSANALSLGGKADVIYGLPGSQTVILGYHATNHSAYLGLYFYMHDARIQWGIAGAAPRTPGGVQAVTFVSFAGPGRTLESGVDRTFSFDYDPEGGTGYGRISASVSGAGDPLVVDLTPQQRAHFDNARFDVFGVEYSLFLFGTQFVADYRFDDLTYTVVPEPSAITALAAAAMIGLRRPRRTGTG